VGLVIGFRELPAPFSLDFLGAPQCALFITPDSIRTLALTASPAWSTSVPNTPSLVGNSFFLQTVVLAGASVSMSDALGLTVGAR
jgi:hypothetical protein